MMRSTPLRAPALAFAAALLISACGGAPPRDTAAAEDAAPDPATACNAVRPEPVVLAVLDYIAAAEPKPLRFLNAVGSDSALPPAAEAAVQDKGPTFYWLAAEKNQQQIRDKLSRDGDWATMLVLVRGDVDNGDGTHLVRVGGRYVGAPHEGLVSPEKRYTVRCLVDSAATWSIADVAKAP